MTKIYGRLLVFHYISYERPENDIELKITNLLWLSYAYMRQWTWPLLIQIMECRLFGGKLLSEPTPTHCHCSCKEYISMKFNFKIVSVIQQNTLKHVVCKIVPICLGLTPVNIDGDDGVLSYQLRLPYDSLLKKMISSIILFVSRTAENVKCNHSQMCSVHYIQLTRGSTLRVHGGIYFAYT